MADKIFINYRREDSIGTAGRLRDRLAEAFGEENLFMDVDNIPAGVDFVADLNNQVAACRVFLAVIGPNWMDAKDASGVRRLDNPDDFVTIEIAAALARDIRVIPVLVDNARMPKADTLPEPIRPLVRRNAVEMRNTQFRRDAEVLIAKMSEALNREPAEPVQLRRTSMVTQAYGPSRNLFDKILNCAPNYFSALAALFSGPKKFIAARLLNTESEWIDALVFLAITISLTSLVLNYPTGHNTWAVLAKNELVTIFLTACGVVALRFSWWLVGGKADAKSFFIAYAYATAGSLIFLAVFQLLAIGFLRLQDPELFARIAKNPWAWPEPEWYEHTSYVIFGWMNMLAVVSAIFWFLLTWGVFRRLTGASKFRSCAAFAINLLLTVPAAVVSFFLVFALQ